jgi:HEAT repeat protein
MALLKGHLFMRVCWKLCAEIGVCLCLSGLLPAGFGQTDYVAQELACLTDSDPAIRDNAAQSLGKYGDPRGFGPLVVALKDEIPGVRASAAIALGQLKDARAVEVLIPLLKDKDEMLQTSAAYALGELNDARAVRPLLVALSDEKSGVSGFAAVALSQITVPKVDSLLACLKDANAGVRQKAAELLSNYHTPAVVAALNTATSDRDPAVRKSATLSLTFLSESDPIKSDFRFLKDANPNVRLGGLMDLERLKFQNIFELLLAALEDSDANVRKGAVEELAKTRDRRAVEPLIAALKDKDAEVERAAAGFLGNFGDQRAVDPLIAALQSPDEFVQAAAAESLGRIKDPRAIEPLIAAVVSPNPSLDLAAGDALGQFKDQRVVEHMIAILNDERIHSLPIGGYIQSAAIFALGEVGDPSAIEPLLQTMKREAQSSLVEDCAKALGKMGSPGVEALIPLVNDQNQGIRWSAYRALARTKSPQAIDAMLAGLRTYDFIVVPIAADFLVTSDDPRALPALFAAMQDPHQGVNSELIAGTLAQAGSKSIEPLVEVLHGADARARFYAARALALIKDHRASEALLAALKERDTAALAGAYSFYIDWGEPGSEDALIEALNKFSGNESHMAGYMLNCGNVKLEAAARAWALDMYKRPMEQSIRGILWGSARRAQPATPKN